MPSYFYHVTLELLLPPSPSSTSTLYSPIPHPNSDRSRGHERDHEQDPSHVLRAAREALKPFLRKRRRGKVAGNETDGDYRDPRVTYSTLTSTSSSVEEGRQRRDRDRIAADQRLDRVSLECIDMVPEREQRAHLTTATNTTDGKADNDNKEGNDQITKGIGTNVLGGLATKGRYVPLDRKIGGGSGGGTDADSAWGIVHLYRDAEETPALAAGGGGAGGAGGAGDGSEELAFLKGAAAARPRRSLPTALPGSSAAASSASTAAAGCGSGSGFGTASASLSANSVAEDCTTLCILAVPSYLSPADFLGLVGEQTREEVSHFRMVRTARANRYMVLMKFRSGKRAREWQREWNGKVFNSMEPETYHVVFVKNVEIEVCGSGESRFPDTDNNDPFIPAQAQSGGALPASSLSTKPMAPPTPSLIELPTCPVCLERMDETTGLLTIICQHVFHCTCLQKWKGSGCPVCRYTQDDFGLAAKRGIGGCDEFGFNQDTGPVECNVCHAEDNLWLCLICGNIGCGRYDGAHAFDHFKQTAHSFTMDLESQRVWDYIGDGYVHRIIQNKADGGKLVELPAADHSALDPPDWADAVPREKWENMSVEYTHLLTSQLESQRTYFEEKVERAADKAAQATAAATSAQEAASLAAEQLRELQVQHSAIINETIPNLERDKSRAEKRAEKFETMARNMEKEWREEKAMNGSLLERVEYLDAEVGKLKAANEDLSEQNRDLTFFISGQEKLKEHGEEVVEGTVSVPEPEASKKKGRRKGKGKG